MTYRIDERNERTAAATELHRASWKFILATNDYENVCQSPTNLDRMERAIEEVGRQHEHAKALLQALRQEVAS